MIKQDTGDNGGDGSGECVKYSNIQKAILQQRKEFNSLLNFVLGSFPVCIVLFLFVCVFQNVYLFFLFVVVC